MGPTVAGSPSPSEILRIRYAEKEQLMKEVIKITWDGCTKL